MTAPIAVNQNGATAHHGQAPPRRMAAIETAANAARLIAEYAASLTGNTGGTGGRNRSAPGGMMLVFAPETAVREQKSARDRSIVRRPLSQGKTYKAQA